MNYSSSSSTGTNQKAVLKSTKGQSINRIVNAAEDGAALATKALSIDDTFSALSWHSINPTETTAIVDYCLNES